MAAKCANCLVEIMMAICFHSMGNCPAETQVTRVPRAAVPPAVLQSSVLIRKAARKGNCVRKKAEAPKRSTGWEIAGSAGGTNGGNHILIE